MTNSWGLKMLYVFLVIITALICFKMIKKHGIALIITIVLAVAVLPPVARMLNLRRNPELSGTFTANDEHEELTEAGLAKRPGETKISYSSQSSNIPSRPSVNREKAITKSEAQRLRGTGYHGTRPNSSAEDSELKAAQEKCKNCGYRTHNGKNSLCDYCSWMETYGGGLP